MIIVVIDVVVMVVGMTSDRDDGGSCDFSGSDGEGG